MQNKKFKKGIDRYLRPLPVILFINIVGVSSVTLAAVVNHMDVPTFIASLSAKKVTVSELKQGKLKNAILIDVRSPEEYAEDRIANSQLVPLTDIQSGFGVHQIQVIAQKYIQTNHTQPTIVLYCTRGPRSVKAYKKLEKTGLNLVFLEGGIKAWRQLIPVSKDVETLAPITAPVKKVVRGK
ncbi:rhodanese-like domain-containing protein [Argonema antarcticum]|uniref:rhodanese-like domain-containing protein n=1 Tax=Argonema antarcticum TaxID=2942763 RepID=UPI00201108DB|nr:rhodanese-like domain-containing protein [Argonema antarcticum]MCL1470206.1 rhodanese-like domain-containing protein [Argonema antarcticum A004/B2]